VVAGRPGLTSAVVARGAAVICHHKIIAYTRSVVTAG
jgi:hypothetical protein